ncbi:MAG: alpha/beta fold hydrolase [Azonexus sp.]|nr:alpha/beta fold hydrolase [Azonexus sp.]MDZ4315351.1 alpha/beta fold hydrolase [Azonexus sp.]
MKQRDIRIESYPASSSSSRAALLFVHGAYVNSSCWTFYFIPFFQAQGYDCFTVDLSGHGDSEGRERIDDFGLADYVDDVTYAIAEIGRRTIVVGHSMGARVLERYLENNTAAAAIFLSPVPTTGTAGSAMQLLLRYPDFLKCLDAAVNGKISAESNEIMTKIYFSPETSVKEVLRFLPMISPESQQAVSEMALPETRFSIRRHKLPVLVIGGMDDAVFPASMLHFLASAWRADLYRAAGTGHMLMLEARWETVAEHMLRWLDKRVSA